MRKYNFELSNEQKMFVEQALLGKNILVDACIGSGKTTAIQYLCRQIQKDRKVLYLTYNKLLKDDARTKIRRDNVEVTNYHGFAYKWLKLSGKADGVAVPEFIQVFNNIKPQIIPYDILIIDEYQDIEQEFAELLEIIKSKNPYMQIIAVGDMEQKIYDKTTLDVERFVSAFLGNYIKLEFTQCFRLSNGLASFLGRVWKKKITGVNDNCKVEEMAKEKVVEFLSQQDPADILCLGARNGNMTDVLNVLENDLSNEFNKNTVYASISDTDSGWKIAPTHDSAIFTTFDSSKGLERKICVVFDFTESYWQTRISKPLQSYKILRNIFCVAASRGKDHIIFVNNGEDMLSEETLSKYEKQNKEFDNMGISKMFDFKYKEDIEACFNLLNVHEELLDDNSVISIKDTDALIDLSPCIGIYQEAIYFDDYQIDEEIELELLFNPKSVHKFTDEIRNSPIEKRTLFLISVETNQDRYITQVETPFISKIQSNLIEQRLSTRLRKDEQVQAWCELPFYGQDKELLFKAQGYADVIKDETVYELKFVSELKHEHFLQCACYMVGLNLSKGILWNTRNNKSFIIEIPDKNKFMDTVLKTVTKGAFEKYIIPQETNKTEQRDMEKYFAVIDTETNYNDSVMSIGVVVAEAETMEKVDSIYFVIKPEYKIGGMYSAQLKKSWSNTAKREDAIYNIQRWLKSYEVQKLFAYNAGFDKRHLPEFDHYEWYDIMCLAANCNYNRFIPKNAECCESGRLKRGYSVENIIRMMTKDKRYCEVHNALYDAEDELGIMKRIEQSIDKYSIALVTNKKSTAKPRKPSTVKKKSKPSMLKTIGKLLK